MGAGTGALIGNALGHTGAGAVVGAGVGAITGAAIGDTLDEIEARNRAMIAAQLGREVRPGPVTIEEIVMMVKAGVEDELIINHIRANGVTRQPGPHELVTLKQEGVSAAVIRAIQEAATPPAPRTVVVREAPPPPVIIEEYHYGPPWWHYPRYRYYYHHPPRTRFSWGVSVYK
ncbi:MAG: glycine zipper domain-containing protein [Thermoguttaceae bacterium]|nr:glycine zipper domain-containing protein [Thermoguttaceae bacterium]MDW8078322.1 glycine zipper domain-containing protein [Thermoguttaceae bacterium]